MKGNVRHGGREEGFILRGEMDRIEWEWNEFDWVSANCDRRSQFMG